LYELWTITTQGDLLSIDGGIGLQLWIAQQEFEGAYGMFYYTMMIYMLNMLMIYSFTLKFMMIHKLGKVHAFQLKCPF